MANATKRLGILKLYQLLPIFLSISLYVEAATADIAAGKPAPAEQLAVEARVQKPDQDDMLVEEDLDGRSAYVNNQFVPSEPIVLIDDIRNTPLYESLQKQMEQVMASAGPDVPIYEDEKSKRQRLQNLPNNRPLFSNYNEDETDEEYMDLLPETPPSYSDADKPDAATVGQEQPNTGGYQLPPSSRPQIKRTTTALPKVTRVKMNPTTKLPETQASSLNQTKTASTSTAAPTFPASHRPGLSNNPQVYQHNRRIMFKTISAGSQFVNSPLGDLMIKFSIGFAKPAQASSVPAASTNEALLRLLSNNMLHNLEMQRFKRYKMRRN